MQHGFLARMAAGEHLTRLSFICHKPPPERSHLPHASPGILASTTPPFAVDTGEYAAPAQWAEPLNLNQWVPGSSPGGCTKQNPRAYYYFGKGGGFFEVVLQHNHQDYPMVILHQAGWSGRLWWVLTASGSCLMNTCGEVRASSVCFASTG